MKILFIANVPSPYRVDFFNELGKLCNLTVLFEKNTSDERDESWKNYEFKNFKGIILQGISMNTDTAFCPGIFKYVLDHSFDKIICSNFTDITGMIAVQTMKLFRIPYYLECDGGFAKNGKGFKEHVKKFIISDAEGYFSTGETCDEYYMTYGAEKSKIIRYPFSSLLNCDLEKNIPTQKEKSLLKKQLGMKEKTVVLTIGQFIPRKGFDVLLSAASQIPKEVGLYFVGGVPTQEYLSVCDKYGLKNVHFEGYKQKNELAKYYKAADLFVLPTREDIWGLVVQEAMAYGLPVIATDRCAAALEVIKQGENGYIVPVEDADTLQEYIMKIIDSDEKLRNFGEKSLQIIKMYTIEKMAECHLKQLKESK